MSDICKALNLKWESLQHACVTIEERGHMDATFMVLSLAHLFLKGSGQGADSKNSHVILVLFQNNFQHLSNIAMKLFLNLKSLIQSKRVTLLQVNSEDTLREKFVAINACVDLVQDESKLVILSNMNSLTYMGAGLDEVLNFGHYMRSSLNSAIIFHCTHNQHDSIIETINSSLKHLSSYVIQVSNLQTGLCKEISGHIHVSNKYQDYKKTHHFLFTNRGVNIFLPGGLSTR